MPMIDELTQINFAVGLAAGTDGQKCETCGVEPTQMSFWKGS
jgi:hypothetical protein